MMARSYPTGMPSLGGFVGTRIVEAAMGMRLSVLLLAAVVTACFSPQYRDCALACGANGACPDGLQCGEDGWCRLDRRAPACATLVNPDGSTAPTGGDQDCVCDPLQQTCCDGDEACDLLGPT
jgi:hypothetical protein